MGPKPIQDVAPAKPAPTSSPDPPTEPELVNDIPVRAPVGDSAPTPPASKDDSNFLILEDKEDKQESRKTEEKPKVPPAKSKPIAAIVLACVAVVLLAAGAYLKFFSSS